MVLPTRGVPRKKTQREVKAKLLTVERKVMVQDRLISPWNMAVYNSKYVHLDSTNLVHTQKFEFAPPGEQPRMSRPRRSKLV